jgi:competence ComEA-like helix-hairpin-helix protein
MRDEEQRVASARLALRASDQLAVALGLCLGAAVVSFVWLAGSVGHCGLVSMAGGLPPESDHVVFAPARIDINRASWAELTLLPGIGKTLGQRIVQSRRREGPFAGVEDMQRVKGIGPATVAKLRPLVGAAASGEE